jgi:hypothetical protein
MPGTAFLGLRAILKVGTFGAGQAEEHNDYPTLEETRKKLAIS